MIQIGVATVRFSYFPVSDTEFRRLGKSLFEAASSAVQERLRLETVDVVLELAEGSVRGRTKIFAAAAAVATFLSQYGSIRQGVEYLAKDVLAAGRLAIGAVTGTAGVTPNDVVSSRRSATLTRRIRGILTKVEAGELSSDAAVAQIRRLLDPENEGVLTKTLVDKIAADVSQVRPRRVAETVQPPPELIPVDVIETFSPGPPLQDRIKPRRGEHPQRSRRLKVYIDRSEGRDTLRIEEE